MELGLSLGDASKAFGLLEKAREITNKGSVGFCMGLSIGPNPIGELEQVEDEEEKEEHSISISISNSNDKNIKKTTTATIEAKIIASLTNSDKNSSINPPIQLDLLPNTPVPRNHHSLIPWTVDNGRGLSCCEVESNSCNVTKGFDVNRLIPVVESEAEAEDGVGVGVGAVAASLSSSPPNSATSSFQMDFSMYRKGGNEVGDAERASSRASDEDDHDNGTTRKKLRLTKEQSAFLEESFKEHNTLNPKQKIALARQLSLLPRQVEVWFQNRRARTKLKQTEVDCENLKRCCETLTEENRRLHKEIQELRALKTSNPFYMQLPATTLTMCPSCERVATTSATNTTTTTSNDNNKKNNTSDHTTSTKATGYLSLTRPRLYPFSHTQTHSHSHHQPTGS